MHKFVYDERGRKTIVELEDDSSASWSELTELFFEYLQGCGYILTREDFAEYVEDAFSDTSSDSFSEAAEIEPSVWRSLRNDPIPQEIIDANEHILFYDARPYTTQCAPTYQYFAAVPDFDAIKNGYTHWARFEQFDSGNQ